MSAQDFHKVRVKATGEVGNTAVKDASAFFMRTHLRYNTPSVWVFFEETGEFRMYSEESLEYLPD